MIPAPDEKDQVTFEGKSYPVRSLTFDELMEVLGRIYAAGLETTPLLHRLHHARQALVLALGVPPEEFGQIKMKVPDILAAIDVVARVTGLSSSSGEATAAATT